MCKKGQKGLLNIPLPDLYAHKHTRTHLALLVAVGKDSLHREANREAIRLHEGHRHDNRLLVGVVLTENALGSVERAGQQEPLPEVGSEAHVAVDDQENVEEDEEVVRVPEKLYKTSNEK